MANSDGGARVKRQRVRVDCTPEVQPWRLEPADDSVWDTFDEDIWRSLGAAEVMPAMRRFLEQVVAEEVVAVPR